MCLLISAKNFSVFYRSVISSVLFYIVVCWGGSIRKRDAKGLDRFVRKSGLVIGTELNSVTSVAVRRTLNKLLTIMDNDSHNTRLLVFVFVGAAKLLVFK